MPVARHLRWYLDRNGVAYDVVHHRHSASSGESADAARVPREKLAKPVILEDERGYLMVVLPASRRVDLRELRAKLQRRLRLAVEPELREIFYDCELGAIPPVASAYGVPALVDRSLLGQQDLYFEAGDHEDLVHLSLRDYLRILQAVEFADVSEAN
jgi:Ala-tRNA(Pro) deacylase